MSKFFSVLFFVLFSFSAFAQSMLTEFGVADAKGTSNYAPSEAPVVFLDQAPNQLNGIFSDCLCAICASGAQVLTDQFVVSTASPTLGITEIVMWAGYWPENIPNTTDNFTITIFEDAAGAPGPVFYTASGLVPTTRVTTGMVLFGVDEYMCTFDYSATPIMIPTNGMYHIQISNNSVESGNFFWETGNLDVTNGFAGNSWAPECFPVVWNFDGATDMAVQINGDDNIPVELTSFTASVNENDVTLNWVTATEINNQGFEIERNSGSGFENIGYVAGFGTSSETHSYSFVDASLNEGTYTYRLKQLDFDGTFEYFDAIEVDIAIPDVFALAQNYPNPFNPSTKIDFSLAVDSKVSLRIFDVLGQEVANLINSNIVAGSHSVDFDASLLNSGVYFYRIEATGIDGTNFTNVKKMILTK
jgi:hypothetical protein